MRAFHSKAALRRERELFAQHLSQKGLRLTRQRRLILEAFLGGRGHLSSEELYQRVRRKDPSIGRATVYRTLKLLTSSGLAREVDFGEGLSRYEHLWGHAHHDHLICTSCGRTLEVMDTEIERLQERLAQRHGFSLTGHKMDLYGLCPRCRPKRQ